MIENKSTMRHNDPYSSRKALLLSSLALAAGGYAFGLSLGESPLVAVPLGLVDLDGDGLVDAQENILETNSSNPDSDSDGFSDLEEFARGSDPMVTLDTPGALTEAVAMTGRVQGGMFKAVTALFVPGGDLTGATVTFGAMVAGVTFPLDPLALFTGASLSVVPVGVNGDVIYLLETPVPESLVQNLGNSGLYVTYSSAGSVVVQIAASINLMPINGVITQIVVGPSGVGSVGGPTTTSTYRPLVDAASVPVTWTPSQVCVQTLSTVGVIGLVIQQQVDSAQCETIGSDSYCAPDCSNLTGTIQQLIDPIGLIGG